MYIGGFANRLRSGYGEWIGLSVTLNEFYRFEGNWANDKPNGEGIASNSPIFPPRSDRVDITSSGNLIDGLWEGQVIQKGGMFTDATLSVMDTTGYLTWLYSGGKFVILGEPRNVTGLYGGIEYPTGYVNGDENMLAYTSSDHVNSLSGIWGFFPPDQGG